MQRLQMPPNTTKGLLITFCGLDGCGKTTIINKVFSEMKNKQELFLTKQPTDFVRKSAIFRTYMDCPNHDDYDYRSLSLLAASDRIQHTNKVIKPELINGKIVLSDRYFYSCLANLRARGYKNDSWIYEIAHLIIKPDIAFFFDIPVDIAVSRVRLRENEKNKYIDMELQYNLRNEYIKICKANNGMLISTEIPEDESYKQVINTIKKVMEEK